MSKKISRRNFLASSTVLGFAAIPFSVAAVELQEEEPEALLTVRNQLGQTGWLMPTHFGPPAWVQPWPDPVWRGPLQRCNRDYYQLPDRWYKVASVLATPIRT